MVETCMGALEKAGAAGQAFAATSLLGSILGRKAWAGIPARVFGGEVLSKQEKGTRVMESCEPMA